MSLSVQSAHWDTVHRVAPLLYLDRLEPFRPVHAGISVFEADSASPSFDRTINLDRNHVRLVVEYAIFWDYDIQHIYDLEHVWVYVGHNGEIVHCEASFHGRYLIGLLRDRGNLSADGRVRLFVQPGKHALSPLEEVFRLLPNAESSCLEEAGSGGVLEPEMFRGQYKTGANIDELAERHLRSFGFRPSFDYIPYKWGSDAFIPWEELRQEIPVRMRTLLATLA